MRGRVRIGVGIGIGVGVGIGVGIGIETGNRIEHDLGVKSSISDPPTIFFGTSDTTHANMRSFDKNHCCSWFYIFTYTQ